MANQSRSKNSKPNPRPFTELKYPFWSEGDDLPHEKDTDDVNWFFWVFGIVSVGITVLVLTAL